MTDVSIYEQQYENFSPYICESCGTFPALCPDHVIAFHLGLNQEASEYIIEVNQRYGYYTLQQWLKVFFRQKQWIWEAQKIAFSSLTHNDSIWINAFKILGFNETKANEITNQIDDNVFSTLDTPYAHAVRYIEIEFSYNEILKGILKIH